MLSEGIEKLNSKMLEPTELKKLDKLEKDNILLTQTSVKGKLRPSGFFGKEGRLNSIK
jgi:hypothetical protein